MSSPTFIFGAGMFTTAWRQDNISELASALQKAKVHQIDSAATYPFTAPGEADRLLGNNQYPEKGFIIDTKILFFGDGSGTLAGSAIQKSLSTSLEGLKVQKVNVLYCHAPDRQTPIAEQAAAMDTEYRKGHFCQLGLCNFPAEMLEEWLRIAEEKGLVKPTVYQGQYNLLCRTYESTIFPILQRHGISFIAYSPLAGGFLTGKLTFSEGAEDLKGTRFEVSDTNFAGMRYRSFYDKPAMHAALRKVAPACEAYGISLADAAVRWLLHHSHLKSHRGDTVIIGPSNFLQFDQYVAAKSAGHLPEDLARDLDAIWEDVKEDAKVIVEY